MRRTCLHLALLVALPAYAADQHQAEALDRVLVTANPLKPTEAESTQPVVVLGGSELLRKASASLGETLSDEVGVTSSSFGPGVGRPIIRGQDGARVRVMSNGLDSLDVSTVSVDHAVTIDPFLADQIEVLKGPATLLYGSGAIGGVVNVVDGRIHERPLTQPISGRAELRANSFNGGSGLARIDARVGSLNVHVDALKRDLGSIDAADGLEVVNSDIETQTGAVGVSYASDQGFLGASLSRFETLYGIPQGVEGSELSDEQIKLDLAQTRLEVKGALYSPLESLERVQVNVGHNNYNHVELADGEIGTRFENQATEGRIEAIHQPIGAWRGVFGLQVGTRDFAAIGDEAFVPPATTDELGAFLLEAATFGAWGVDLGARFGRQTTELSDGTADSSHALASFSSGLSYAISADTRVSVGFDHAERAPSAEELFSNGPHEGTASFEIGDADLDTETAQQLEVSLHHHAERFHGTLSVYQNQVDQFIYQLDTGEIEDDLPVRVWSQTDAKFRGFEAEGRFDLVVSDAGTWQARLFTDRVRAKTRDGENLPRISPWRVGAGLQFSGPVWQAGFSATHTGRQNDVAPLETETRSYNLLSANVAYQMTQGESRYEVFARASNLTDEFAQVHTSLLKDRAPLAGRQLDVGLRFYF